MIISDLELSGHVKDISETGCSFEVPKIISLFKGLGLIATFTLPNDVLIKDLHCTIIIVKYNQIHRKTEIGATFLESGRGDFQNKGTRSLLYAL